ncbi:hypothetical protein COO60DRAFT_1678087 [Scenedesmus sp. NREL 46B-D3]|nr:hypothetical protein COO60DRAFT_1678087 [Scenedesmus sp. NREL 46B-D3]
MAGGQALLCGWVFAGALQTSCEPVWFATAAHAHILLFSTKECPTENCGHVFRKEKVKRQHAAPWTGSRAEVPRAQTRQAAHNTRTKLEQYMEKVKRLAEELGLEVVVAAIGVLKTGAGATRMGQEHISFKSSTPFISNLHVPGGDHELSIAALLAGTGGPLTAALDDPEQGSMLANACLESLASNACMAFHEWLQAQPACAQTCRMCVLLAAKGFVIPGILEQSRGDVVLMRTAYVKLVAQTLQLQGQGIPTGAVCVVRKVEDDAERLALACEVALGNGTTTFVWQYLKDELLNLLHRVS